MEPGFAFDIELLLRTETLHPGSIARVPIVWVDSDEASTTTDLAPYLYMLKAAARMYRAHPLSAPESDALAGFIEGLSPADWQRLVRVIPSEIGDEDPKRFGHDRPLGPEDLERLLSGGGGEG